MLPYKSHSSRMNEFWPDNIYKKNHKKESWDWYLRSNLEFNLKHWVASTCLLFLSMYDKYGSVEAARATRLMTVSSLTNLASKLWLLHTLLPTDMFQFLASSYSVPPYLLHIRRSHNCLNDVVELFKKRRIQKLTGLNSKIVFSVLSEQIKRECK